MNDLNPGFRGHVSVFDPTQLSESNLRALLVEDSPSDALIISRLLRLSSEERFEVEHVTSLSEAMAAIARTSFDVVLLDLGLPDARGLDAFSMLGDKLSFPVIVTSGMSDEKLAARAVKLGAQDYLTKDDLSGPQLERSIRYARERHRLLVELERARVDAEAASVAKSAFLAVMSHEFRTPMNGIIGALSLIDESELSSENRQLLGIMRSCAAGQLELINDVLDISRIESGALDLDLDWFSIRELVNDVCRSYSVFAAEKSLKLSWAVSDEGDLGLRSDRALLKQVLMKLVGNAIKFTEEGEVQVTVEREASAWLRFTVSDTGIGIEPSKLEAVFDVFVQADSSKSRRFQGVGLGLAISKRIVALLGGNIAVESLLGVGSEFIFRLPLEKDRSTADWDAEGLSGSRSKLFASLGRRFPLSVLIVDDNELSRALGDGVFRRLGYLPVLARSGEEAVELASKQPIDLILMDLQMPGADGLEASSRIRSQGEGGARRPYIVALTARTESYGREECLARGMDAFLPKPVNPTLAAALAVKVFRERESK